jgi:hypothetical protein
MSQANPFKECMLEAEETDYYLPITKDERATLRAAVSVWEDRMLEEEDDEARVKMNHIYNRLKDRGGDGLIEP